MKKNILIAVAVIAIGAVACETPPSTEKVSASQNEKNISPSMDDMIGWSDASKMAAMTMKKQYGEPTEKTASMMMWKNTGQWKRTVVYAKEFQHDFPMPHTDVMQQWIDYKVPAEKFHDLAHYDGSVVCNRTNGEISARCDKEGANFLAINLANDIITGKKDVKSARDFYAKSIKEMINGGKPEYMQKLVFNVANGNTADPDKPNPIITEADMMKAKKMNEMMEKDMMEKDMGMDDMIGWSDASKMAAMTMKKQYGEPTEKTATMMMWKNTGQWKRTVVYAKEFQHDFPMPHTDVMEQCIDYKVPAEKFHDLAHYDGSVICNRTNGEISARCDKEGANFLAINLANDIITGKKDVNSARDFYAKLIKEMINGGKPEYMQKLVFNVANGNTADPDKPNPIITEADMMKAKKMNEMMKNEMMEKDLGMEK